MNNGHGKHLGSAGRTCAQTFTTPSKGNVFTYSVAPRWHVDANTMVYARLATGYRPGGPNALPPAAAGRRAAEYGADKTVNVELGVRSTQLDGRLSIDVAAFHVNWKDIQLFESSTVSASTPTAARPNRRAWNGRSPMCPCMG